MSKPIYAKVKVKVKYDQEHYISLSSEFIGDRNLLDILIGFGVMAERLNPMSEFSVFFGVFRPSWRPLTKIKNSKNATI